MQPRRQDSRALHTHRECARTGKSGLPISLATGGWNNLLRAPLATNKPKIPSSVRPVFPAIRRVGTGSLRRATQAKPVPPERTEFWSKHPAYNASPPNAAAPGHGESRSAIRGQRLHGCPPCRRPMQSRSGAEPCPPIRRLRLVRSAIGEYVLV